MLYRGPQGRLLPPQTVIRFSAMAAAGALRVYACARVVQVAQQAEARGRAAANWRCAVLVALLTPVLMLIVAVVVTRHHA